MNRVAQCLEGAFVEGFAQRWVDVDGAGDAFELGAHFFLSGKYSCEFAEVVVYCFSNLKVRAPAAAKALIKQLA